MDHTAEGEELRVPSLSPKWQEEEWKSIGRILVRDLITTALKGELLGEDRDDRDLLDRMGVTSPPAKDNLKGILLQVAHKQLIQIPRYAMEKNAINC